MWVNSEIATSLHAGSWFIPLPGNTSRGDGFSIADSSYYVELEIGYYTIFELTNEVFY